MSLHADAHRTLSAWRPTLPEQQQGRARLLEYLDSTPDAMERSGRPDHLTASTLILDHKHRAVLLTLHGRAKQWFQVGGHCEAADERLVDAAAREAREESGIDDLRLDPVPIEVHEHPVPFCDPGAAGQQGRDVHHLDVRFLAVAPAGAEAVISQESLDLRWWPVDDLPNPELVPMVEAALRRLSEDRTD